MNLTAHSVVTKFETTLVAVCVCFALLLLAQEWCVRERVDTHHCACTTSTCQRICCILCQCVSKLTICGSPSDGGSKTLHALYIKIWELASAKCAAIHSACPRPFKRLCTTHHSTHLVTSPNQRTPRCHFPFLPVCHQSVRLLPVRSERPHPCALPSASH